MQFTHAIGLNHRVLLLSMMNAGENSGVRGCCKGDFEVIRVDPAIGPRGIGPTPGAGFLNPVGVFREVKAAIRMCGWWVQGVNLDSGNSLFMNRPGFPRFWKSVKRPPSPRPSGFPSPARISCPANDRHYAQCSPLRRGRKLFPAQGNWSRHLKFGYRERETAGRVIAGSRPFTRSGASADRRKLFRFFSGGGALPRRRYDAKPRRRPWGRFF